MQVQSPQTARPLPPGAIIDYCGEKATVIFDDGGRTVSVRADGFRQNWYWDLEGVACTVVSVPDTTTQYFKETTWNRI